MSDECLRMGPDGNPLNGAYWDSEKETFVTYVQGKRWFEFDGKGMAVDYKKGLKERRSI